MTEKEKAEQLYNSALNDFGIKLAKGKAIKIAEEIHSFAPHKRGKMRDRSYWERVIKLLNTYSDGTSVTTL